MYFIKEIKRDTFTVSHRIIDRIQEMIVNLCAIQNVKVASTQVLQLTFTFLFTIIQEISLI